MKKTINHEKLVVPNYMLKDLRVGERTGVAVCGLTDDIDKFFYKANVN